MGRIPGRYSLAETFVNMEGGVYENRHVLTDCGAYGTPHIVWPDYAALQDTIIKGLDPLYLNKATAAELVPDICAQVATLLSRPF